MSNVNLSQKNYLFKCEQSCKLFVQVRTSNFYEACKLLHNSYKDYSFILVAIF